MMSEVAGRIRELLDPILDSRGLFLWEMDFGKVGPKWLLRIYIDREAGVTLEDCETVSRDLSAVLDVEDFIPHEYTLEVSSPGLDRTLHTPEHFKRFIGSGVRVKTFLPINGEKVFHGELAGMKDSIVRLMLEGGKVMEIPLGDISKASLEVKF
jgi:ribosome maturation factor RimP